jgi:hypothetical protein
MPDIDDTTSPALQAAESQDQRVATPAERQLAASVARFVTDNSEPGERIDPMVAMCCIARQFPGIPLEAALCGFVFRSLLYPKVLQ